MDPVLVPSCSRWPRPLIFFLVFVVTAGLAFFLYFRSRPQSFVPGFLSDPSSTLTSTLGRTNILLFGLGGATHDAGDLTDSLIFVSFRHADHSLTLLPLPRDIWVDTLVAKINTAYHYGQRREGGGLDLVKSAAAEVTGQPVHYAIGLDFEGFVKAVDAVGGLDIEVPRTFDDYFYPIPGKETVEPESERYEHLHFEAGPTHFDGETALKYARSRHAEGEEGTDFARSARQEQILLAFKDRLLNTQTLLSPSTIKELTASFIPFFVTDLSENELGSLIRALLAFVESKQSFSSLSLTDYLVNPRDKQSYQGQWVLVPVKDWSEIHDYVAKNLAE